MAGQVVLEQRDIFEYAQGRNQREVLEYHADAQSTGIARRGNLLAHAADADFAGVGRVIAIEYFRQRTLAGPILAQQRDHFSRPDVEKAISLANRLPNRLTIP